MMKRGVRKPTLSIAAALALLGVVPSGESGRSSACAGRLVSSSFGYASCATGTFVTRDGRSWRHVAEPGYAAWFLDRRHAWATTNDCARARAALHRTRDGGRTWHSTPIRWVNCSAGSHHQVSFVDPQNGWLVAVLGNAYTVDLFRTRDGGRTWRFVRGELPIKGTIRFETTRVGWLAEGWFDIPQRLYVTRDGGRTWRRRVLPPPPGWAGARMFPAIPSFFGRRGVVPVSLIRGGHSAVAFYVTADVGRSWRLRAVRRVARPVVRSRFKSSVNYVPTDIVSPTVWWAVAGRFLRNFHVTTDAGRTWRVTRAQHLPGSVRAEISAVGPTNAWLTSRDSNVQSTLYATSDGGRSWRRLAPR